MLCLSFLSKTSLDGQEKHSGKMPTSDFFGIKKIRLRALSMNFMVQIGELKLGMR
jgi:hypothetical protein